MDQLLTFYNNLDFKSLIWSIPIILLLHELEEWNILKWYDELFIDIPKSTNFSLRIWLILISAIYFVITGLSFVISNNTISAYIMAALIMVTIENGLQHIYWTIYFKRYAPGVVFSSIGIIFGLLVFFKALSEGYLHYIIVILLFLLLIPTMVETVKSKNRLTKEVRKVHELGIKITRLLNK